MPLTISQQASPSALLLQSRQQAVQHCLSCDVRQAVQHWMHVGIMVCKCTRQHAAKGQGFVPWDSKPQTRSNKILPGNQPTHEGWPSMQPWPHLLSSIAHVVSKTSCSCGASRPCHRNWGGTCKSFLSGVPEGPLGDPLACRNLRKFRRNLQKFCRNLRKFCRNLR